MIVAIKFIQLERLKTKANLKKFINYLDNYIFHLGIFLNLDSFPLPIL